MVIKATHLRWVGSALAAVVILPIAGQYSIEYANELGFYKQPVERVHSVITLLTQATWFHWLGGAILGFTMGVWVDALVRKRESGIDEPTRADLTAIGGDLKTLSEDVHRFAVEHKLSRRRPESGAIGDRWEAERAKDEEERALFAQRLGARIQVAFLSLDRIGVPIPFHLQHFTPQSIPTLGSYLGTVATLLTAGDLQKARSLDKETLWRMGSM